MPLATEVPVPVSAHGVAQFGLGHHMLSISPQDNVERGAVMGVEVGCCPGIRSQSLSSHVTLCLQSGKKKRRWMDIRTPFDVQTMTLP